MKKSLTAQLLVAISFFALSGCEYQENQNKPINESNSQSGIVSPVESNPSDSLSSDLRVTEFRLLSENPTNDSVIRFSIKTEGEPAEWLIHERRPNDDNQSIIPSLSDSRWSRTKPESYTLLNTSESGSKVVYLFVKDSNGNVAERKSIHVSYRNGEGCWSYLGENVSNGAVIDTSIAVYKESLYVAFAKSVTGNKTSRTNKEAHVVKCENGKWSELDGKISDGFAMFTDIAVDDSGRPCVAFRDSKYGNRLIVKRFENGKWKNLGSSDGISESTANNIRIALYGKRVFVSFKDYSVKSNGRVSVVEYTESDNKWVYLGAGISDDKGSDIDMAISSDGFIYISFREESSKKASVLCSDLNKNADWKYLGSRSFTEGGVSYPSIAIWKGYPVLFYRDEVVDSYPTVKIFRDGRWDTLGKRKFSKGKMSSSNGDIAVAGDTLYSTFKEEVGAGNIRASVMKYKDDEWVYVGGAGFTPYSVDYISMASGDDNKLMIAFKDWGSADNVNPPYTYSLSVVKFD